MNASSGNPATKTKLERPPTPRETLQQIIPYTITTTIMVVKTSFWVRLCGMNTCRLSAVLFVITGRVCVSKDTCNELCPKDPSMSRALPRGCCLRRGQTLHRFCWVSAAGGGVVAPRLAPQRRFRTHLLRGCAPWRRGATAAIPAIPSGPPRGKAKAIILDA